MSAVVVPDMNHPESGGGVAAGRMVGSPAYHLVIRERNVLLAPVLTLSCLRRFHHLWESARETLAEWAKEGKIQVREGGAGCREWVTRDLALLAVSSAVSMTQFFSAARPPLRSKHWWNVTSLESRLAAATRQAASFSLGALAAQPCRARCH